jgi:hypothetical protein
MFISCFKKKESQKKEEYKPYLSYYINEETTCHEEYADGSKSKIPFACICHFIGSNLCIPLTREEIYTYDTVVTELTTVKIYTYDSKTNTCKYSFTKTIHHSDDYYSPNNKYDNLFFTILQSMVNQYTKLDAIMSGNWKTDIITDGKW